jgi:arylsulfatase A-like enzyme/Tfp pilus assembly protein PilF
MTRRSLLAFVPGVLAIAVGLHLSSRGTAQPAGRTGLNLLLVTVDTLPADALGSYGDAQAMTPVLDRLAQAGARFERARAHNVVTLPSHANILSGRHPFEHGVRDNAGYRFPSRLPTIATLLKARGYRTGAFVSAFPLDSRFGLDQGFDVYDDRLGDPERVAAFRMSERPGPETVAAARAFIESQAGRPWFCWVHLYEPHAPYEPPRALAARFASAPYKGEVAAADAALAPLLEPLLAQGRNGNTLVVVTADHGESLGEHGEKTHGIFAYDATLRVPLIVFAPALFGPRVVPDPVRHVDILPTVLDALALPAPAGLPGRSILAAARGKPLDPAPTYFEALTAAANRGWAELHGVVRDERKYIRLPTPELYEIASDVHERQNVAPSRVDRVAELGGLLRGYPLDAAAGARRTESAETRERLQSLGYLASTAAATPAGQAGGDPKDLIAYEIMLEDAIALQAKGDVQGALLVGRELVRRQPRSALALLHVAVMERDAGHLDVAIGLLDEALASSPNEPQALALIGRYLVEAGRPEAAVQRLRAAAARDEADVDVLMALGAAQAQAGQGKEAIAVLTRARDVDPTNALAWLNLGTAQLMNGDSAAARGALRAAIDREPALARAQTSLGVIAAREGRADEAILHWRRALELHAGDYDALYNLGALLFDHGRRDEARPYLDRFAREAPESAYARDIRAVRRLLGARPVRG